MSFEIFGIAGVVFGLSVWLTNRLASPSSMLRVLDHPNERSLHAAPIPRTGGLAIVAGLATGLVLEGFWIAASGRLKNLEAQSGMWILGMGALLVVVSLYDDWGELSPGLRFGVHGLATAGVVLGAGLTIDAVSIPLLGTLPLRWASVPMTMLCLMWMINLYNFMDGMDGFAGGMTIIGFGFLAYLTWRSEYALICAASVLVIGSASGFWFYNKPPAKIFMGDVGSILLGFLAGALSIMGIHFGVFEWGVPVLIFSPFIVDATVTLGRRLARGEKIWQAHREHYYQRLVLLGWSHRKTVAVEYCLMIACGLSAVAYTRIGTRERLALLITWTLIYAALAGSVRFMEQRSTAAHRL